jgi:hypothetical protein
MGQQEQLGFDGIDPLRCVECGRVLPKYKPPSRGGGKPKTRFCSRECNTKYGNSHGRKKWVHIKSRYGISQEEHDAMFAAQSGRCAICQIPAADAVKGTLYIDHCHDTGVVRGLLCNGCNAGLGHFRDNEAVLLTAAWYLELPPGLHYRKWTNQAKQA